MKTRKFTKVISFILSIAFIFSTVAVKASAYSTVTTTYDCPKSLCFSDLVISGPYGNPSETVDGGVPHLGGMTYEAVYNEHYGGSKLNDYHMYIVYCSKYDNSDSSLLRHTMTLMFANHGYTTVGYTQYNGSYHYANQKCDHGTDFKGSNVYALTQHLCGENAYLSDETMVNIADEYQAQNGCGAENAVLENHTWVYGSWYANGDNYHSRTKTCSDCGYSTVVSDVHSLTEGSWVNSSSTQHKKTTTCSVCDYSKTSYADHSLNTSEAIRYGTDDENDSTYPHGDYHKYEITCSDCSYESTEYEPHEMYVENPWFDSDATYHNQITRCYHCSYGVSTYRYHNYPQELYTYVSVNETTHSITKHCDTCTHTVDGGTASHNFVTGEWTGFDDSDPNADVYDCNVYHKRTLTCSDCGYVKYEYVEHNIQIDEYTSQNADRHSCVPKCTDCSYSYNLNEPHSFNEEDYSYEVIDKDFHLFIKPCEKCDYAYEVREYHKDNDSNCYCDDCGYLMTKFSVTVPTTMALTMGNDGEIYSPSDVVIINNSTAAVSVTKADLSSQNGWNIVPYATNMANEKVDSKKIGFEMNGIQTDSAGITDSLSYNNEWIIEKDKSSAVVYDAVISATSTPIENEQIMNVVFIVDWE